MKSVVLTKEVIDDQNKFVEVKEEFREPELIAGSVIVNPAFTRIGANTKAWSLGQYILSAQVMKQISPWIPGTDCVGRIDKVASDVYGLKEGQFVYTSSLASSIKNDDSIPSDSSLIGFIPSQTKSPLFNLFKNGCMSEKVLLPVGSVYPLPDSIKTEEDLLQYMHVGAFSIAFGALRKGEVKIGEVLLVNGAYGNLGSTAVQVGLLFGCSKIYCVGRSKEKLEGMTDKMEKLFPGAQRIIITKTYEELLDVKDADVGIDFIGNIDDPKPTEACIKTLKTGGRYVCCGGSKANLTISFFDLLIRQLKVCGSFMFERDVPMKVIRLIQSGQLKVPEQNFGFVEFNEKEVNDAIERNAIDRGLDLVLMVNKMNFE